MQFNVKEGRKSAEAASLYAAPNDPIDFAENILRLVDSPDLRRQMGEFGRRRIHDVLAWHHQEPKLLRAYESLFEL